METDFLESQQFYELMQDYRNSSITNQRYTTERYEAVKRYIRERMRSRLEKLTDDFKNYLYS